MGTPASTELTRRDPLRQRDSAASASQRERREYKEMLKLLREKQLELQALNNDASMAAKSRDRLFRAYLDYQKKAEPMFTNVARLQTEIQILQSQILIVIAELAER